VKVETGELPSIGRFARHTGLNVKALRHYDAEGLLSPAHVVDGPATGTTRPAGPAMRSRSGGCASWSPLDEIAAVPHAEPDTVREREAVHRARLQGRAVEGRQLIQGSTSSSMERSLLCRRRRSSPGSKSCPSCTWP
jgi:MerR family regulatory protein